MFTIAIAQSYVSSIDWVFKVYVRITSLFACISFKVFPFFTFKRHFKLSSQSAISMHFFCHLLIVFNKIPTNLTCTVQMISLYSSKLDRSSLWRIIIVYPYHSIITRINSWGDISASPLIIILFRWVIETWYKMIKMGKLLCHFLFLFSFFFAHA